MPDSHYDGNQQNDRKPKPSKNYLFERARGGLANRGFSFALDINFLVLSGVIAKLPTVVVVGATKFVWSRLRVLDQARAKRGAYLPLRFEGQLAQWAYDNLDLDDHVCIVGRIWEGNAKQSDGRTVRYNWIQVERATCGLPVQLDSDPNYLRVRKDVWNRMQLLAGKDVDPTAVPERVKATIRWEDVDPFEVDESLESMGPPPDDKD